MRDTGAEGCDVVVEGREEGEGVPVVFAVEVGGIYFLVLKGRHFVSLEEIS